MRFNWRSINSDCAISTENRRVSQLNRNVEKSRNLVVALTNWAIQRQTAMQARTQVADFLTDHEGGRAGRGLGSAGAAALVRVDSQRE
jgi:hypothetical protein